MSSVSNDTSCKKISEMVLQLLTLWSEDKQKKISRTVVDTVCKMKNCPTQDVLRGLITEHITGEHKLSFTAALSEIRDWNFLFKQFLEKAGYELRDTVLFDKVADDILKGLWAGDVDVTRCLEFRAGSMSFVLQNFKVRFNKKHLPRKCVSREVNIVTCDTETWSALMGAWHLQMFYYASSGCQHTVSDSRCETVYASVRQWEKDVGIPSQLLTHSLDTLSGLLPPISVMRCGNNKRFEELLREWIANNDCRIKWVFSQFPFISIEAALSLAASQVVQVPVLADITAQILPLDCYQQQVVTTVAVNNGNYAGNLSHENTYNTPPHSNSLMLLDSPSSLNLEGPVNNFQSGCRSSQSSNSNQVWSGQQQQQQQQQQQRVLERTSSFVSSVSAYSPFSSASPSPRMTAFEHHVPAVWGNLESGMLTPPPLNMKRMNSEGSTFSYNPYG